MLLRVPDDVLRLIADLLEDPALAAGIREEGGQRRGTGDGAIPRIVPVVDAHRDSRARGTQPLLGVTSLVRTHRGWILAETQGPGGGGTAAVRGELVVTHSL